MDCRRKCCVFSVRKKKYIYIWNIYFGLARIIYSPTLCCWLQSASSSTGRWHERGLKAFYLFDFFPQSCPFFRSKNGDEMFWVKVMSFFPVRQSETSRPGENPPFTLDFQHLEEFRCCRIASCVSRLLLPACHRTARLSTTVISTHSLPILTHTGIAHTHFCTHTFLQTHTHALILSILFLWPMLTQDTWRPKEQTKSWQHQVAWLAAKGLHRLTKFTARCLLRLWTAHVVKCFHYSVSSFCIHQQQKAPSCTLVFRYSLSPISAV